MKYSKTKILIQIAKEEKDTQTKELNRPKYWCENCGKLFSDIEILHTGSGNICIKCGKEIKEKDSTKKIAKCFCDGRYRAIPKKDDEE